jgi:hypothetical protein
LRDLSAADGARVPVPTITGRPSAAGPWVSGSR